MSTTTKGALRVRTKFNPSEKDVVRSIKETTAALIDTVDALGGSDDTLNDTGRAEQARLKALAMTAYEEAAMWAVKAATV